MTYTWTASEQSAVSHSGKGATDSTSFTWSAPGHKMIAITASGLSAPTGMTRSVVVFDVAASGANKGKVGVSYTFSAEISPDDTWLPVRYTWKSTGNADVVQDGWGTAHSVSLKWTTPGTKTVTVTATVAGESVTTTRSIVIEASGPTSYGLFLPLIVDSGTSSQEAP